MNKQKNSAQRAKIHITEEIVYDNFRKKLNQQFAKVNLKRHFEEFNVQTINLFDMDI